MSLRESSKVTEAIYSRSECTAGSPSLVEGVRGRGHREGGETDRGDLLALSYNTRH